jgi:feruloyl esterase
MRGFREALARLQAFRSKFEGLLASARKKAARDRVAPGRRPTRLRELTGFGSNPGNLRMFAYAPEHLSPKAPLVIALHGCTQTSDEYDHGTGWSSLADSLGRTPLLQPTGDAPAHRQCLHPVEADMRP